MIKVFINNVGWCDVKDVDDDAIIIDYSAPVDVEYYTIEELKQLEEKLCNVDLDVFKALYDELYDVDDVLAVIGNCRYYENHESAAIQYYMEDMDFLWQIHESFRAYIDYRKLAADWDINTVIFKCGYLVYQEVV